MTRSRKSFRVQWRDGGEENETQKAAKDAENGDTRAAAILTKSLCDLCSAMVGNLAFSRELRPDLGIAQRYAKARKGKGLESRRPELPAEIFKRFQGSSNFFRACVQPSHK